MSIGTHNHGDSFDRQNRVFAFSVGLNVVFIGVEVVSGIAGGSLALLADAGHNATDVLSLLLAWGASLLAARAPDHRRTYGFRRATILAALANSLLITGAVGVIVFESVSRLIRPELADARVVVVVALVGVAINTATALLFVRGRKSDLNLGAAFAHMTADALVSVGVVVSGVVLAVTGWMWVDPVVGLAIAVVVVWGTWSILRGSLNLALDAVPDNIDLGEVRDYLASLPGVLDVHDLHVWALSTTEVALTAHLLRPDMSNEDELLREAARALCERFGICHITLQWERGDDGVCGNPC
jgi:cobalt-zinc-cadmium efflux system protein